MLTKVEKKIIQQGFKVAMTDEAKDFLLEKGFDPNFGARPLQRSIQRLLEDPLAEDILSKRVAPASTVYVDFDPEAKKLVFSTSPIPKPVKSA
jgi:ATP-dependent Clp protease ATP-binding subunit ClpC